MHLVFDFGAVMVDWQPAQVVAAYFPTLTHDSASAQALGQSLFSHPAWKAFDQGKLHPEQVIQQLHTTLHLPSDNLASMVHGIADLLHPIDSSVQLLQQLVADRQRYGLDQIVFLSNMPAPYARRLEQQHAWVQWFDGGIFSGDVQLAKPDPAIYQLTEDLLHTPTLDTDILFIDDQAANIEQARKRGWHTLHLTQPSKLPEQLLAMLPKIMR